MDVPHLRGAAGVVFLLLLSLGANLAGACAEPQVVPRTAPAQRRVALKQTAFVAGGAPGTFRERLDVTTFQRGNIHTHTTESDGDSTPEEVYAWYRDHGYNFLGISDHNRFTDPALYRHLERPGFVIIPAEEITMKPGGAHVHVNVLCERHGIGAKRFDTVGEALRWSIAQGAAQNAVSLVNHPNFHWAFGAEALPDMVGARLLEVWSGHPGAYSDGDATHPSVESMWDEALSQGMDIAAAAVDDMHTLHTPRNSRKAGPGRGWVEVFAHSASERDICRALAQGALLASNGVKIARLTVHGDTMSVVALAPGGVVDFIGQDGVSLARQGVDPGGAPSVYRLAGGEQYVRARVTAADGTRAWTQAYRVAY